MLKTPIQRRHIQTDARIEKFWRGHGGRVLDALPVAEDGQIAVIEQAIRDGVAVELLYLKGGFEEIRRRVYPRALAVAKHQNVPFMGMKALDEESREEVLFSVERILQITRAA